MDKYTYSFFQLVWGFPSNAPFVALREPSPSRAQSDLLAYTYTIPPTIILWAVVQNPDFLTRYASSLNEVP